MSVTRSDILKIIDECEKKGEFDKHVDPVDFNNAIPVDEHFPYIDKPLGMRIKFFLSKMFIIRPFKCYKNIFVMKTKITGRENLKGMKRAVVTSNHVNIWDCLTIMKAVRGHKLYITAAYFNNQKGFLGEMMRASGLLPLSQESRGMKKFIQSVNRLLQGNHYVLFYPEQAMWWNYEKPRPYKDGAFHFAAENKVPIVPVFITFTPRKKLDEEGIPMKQFTVHILPPIYPKQELSKRENITYMKEKNFELCKNKYEEFYGKKLEYLT